MNCEKPKIEIPDKEQKIFLVRHAKPQLPPGGKVYYGHTDYPLADEGTVRARELGVSLKDIKFDAMYSSDLKRAAETAKLIEPDRISEIKITAALREIHLGEWEGRTFDEVREKWTEIYEKRGKAFSTQAPPGGESFVELQRRSVPAFGKIIEESPSGNILVVAHAAFIWTIMCALFAFNLDDLFFYPMDYCGVHLLHNSKGYLKMLRYNWNEKIMESTLPDAKEGTCYSLKPADKK
jgi:broad specificity phosphatase PhoE